MSGRLRSMLGRLEAEVEPFRPGADEDPLKLERMWEGVFALGERYIAEEDRERYARARDALRPPLPHCRTAKRMVQAWVATVWAFLPVGGPEWTMFWAHFQLHGPDPFEGRLTAEEAGELTGLVVKVSTEDVGKIDLGRLGDEELDRLAALMAKGDGREPELPIEPQRGVGPFNRVPRGPQARPKRLKVPAAEDGLAASVPPPEESARSDDGGASPVALLAEEARPEPKPRRLPAPVRRTRKWYDQNGTDDLLNYRS